MMDSETLQTPSASADQNGPHDEPTQEADLGPEPLTRPGSKQWMRFQSALRLAIQRVSHKWTYEEFAQCFPLMCDEDPQNAAGVFDDIRLFMTHTMEQKCEVVLNQYTPAVNEGINELAVVSKEAKHRLLAGVYDGKDVWRENIAPRDAVRARTIPLLEDERDRLQRELAELEQRSAALRDELQANVHAREEADAEASRVLDTLDEVIAKWEELPDEFDEDQR